MSAARQVSSRCASPCSVTSTGTPGRLVRVAHRPGQRQRVDVRRAQLVQRAPGRGRQRPAAVVPGALVVLHADEVVVPRQRQPPAVHLGALAVPDRGVVAHHLVVDDGQAEAHRQPGPPGLDGLPRRPVPGRHAAGHGVHLLGQHDVSHPVARHPGRLARGGQRGPLQVTRLGGDVEPAEQAGEVRLVERDGPGRAVTQMLGHDAAVAGEQRRSLRVEPPAALARTSAAR